MRIADQIAPTGRVVSPAVTAVVLLLAPTLVPAAIAGDIDFQFDDPVVISFDNNQWPSHMAAADLNGDGHVDIVVAGRNNDGIMYILQGNGDGTFAEPEPFELVTQTDWVTIADLNGDGHFDLAFAMRSQRGRVGVLFGDSSGVFDGKSAVYYSVGRVTQCVIAADLNNNGHLDLVTANYSSNTIRVLYNNGDGVFATGAPIVIDRFVAGIVGPNQLQAADLNADGFTDVILTSIGSSRVTILLNTGDGTFHRPTTRRPPPDSEGIGIGLSNSVIADMNNNGEPDIVVPTISLSTAQHFVIYPNQGDGAFADSTNAFASSTLATNWSVAAADFDGDGRLDLAFGLALPGRLTLVRNTTDGESYSFAPPEVVASVGSFVRFVLPVDLDDDGAVDLVYTDFSNHQVRIQRNLTPQGGGGVAAIDPPARTAGTASQRERRLKGPADNLVDLTGDGIVNGADGAVMLNNEGDTP